MEACCIVSLDEVDDDDIEVQSRSKIGVNQRVNMRIGNLLLRIININLLTIYGYNGNSFKFVHRVGLECNGL